MIEARKAWRGEATLAVTLWVYGAGGLLALAVVGYALTWLLEFVVLADAPGLHVAIPYFALAWAVLTLIYLGFALIATWRSVGNYNGPRIWSVLTRGFIVVFLAAAGVALLGLYLVPA